MSRLKVALATGLLVISCAASFASDAAWRTSAPITYVLDYGREHLDNPGYIEAVAGSPPTLLHLGKDLVMSHLWGPIQGVGGENVAGGGDDEYIRLLTPEETRERQRALTEMVANLHEAGVRWVVPYICSVTIGGHHVRREGFWEFYDRWDEYLEFGLPPRPELDPIEWMQLLPDGTLKPTYGCKADRDEFYPQWEPRLRYAACVNNPAWRAWLDSVVRLLAEVGYDGVFVDNAGQHQCYCRFCEEKYQSYLREKFSDEQIAALFGVEAGGRVGLTPPPARNEPPSPGWVETQRFWRESIRDHHEAIRRAGEEVAESFIIFPNGAHRRPETIGTGFRDSDFAMYELSTGEHGTNPGLARSRIIGDVHVNVRNHQIWELSHMRAIRSGLGALLLTRGGWPSQVPSLQLNERTAALGNAQAAAFGSGSGFLLRPLWDQYRDVLNSYRSFFEEQEGLYAGLLPYAQIGVAAFGEQNFYGHSMHIDAVNEITEALSKQRILFDYLTEQTFTAEELRRFSAVILADLKYVTVEQIAALDEYVRGGGTALIIGEPPTHDPLMIEHAPQSLPVGLQQREADRQRAELQDGEGRWYRQPVLSLNTMIEIVNPAPELSLAPGAGPGLRVSAFIDPDARSSLVVHLLDFDAPLGVDPPPYAPKSNLELRVPLPEGASVISVTAFAPGAEPESIGHTVVNGRLRLVLPTLDTYRVLRVELGQGG